MLRTLPHAMLAILVIKIAMLLVGIPVHPGSVFSPAHLLMTLLTLALLVSLALHLHRQQSASQVGYVFVQLIVCFVLASILIAIVDELTPVIQADSNQGLARSLVPAFSRLDSVAVAALAALMNTKSLDTITSQ